MSFKAPYLIKSTSDLLLQQLRTLISLKWEIMRDFTRNIFRFKSKVVHNSSSRGNFVQIVCDRLMTEKIIRSYEFCVHLLLREFIFQE